MASVANPAISNDQPAFLSCGKGRHTAVNIAPRVHDLDGSITGGKGVTSTADQLAGPGEGITSEVCCSCCGDEGNEEGR